MLTSLCKHQLLGLVQRAWVCSPSAAHSLASYGTDSSTSAPEASSRTSQQSSAASAASTSSSRSLEKTWSEAEYLQDYEDEQAGEQEQAVDGQQLLRQVLRRTHAAEVRHTTGIQAAWQVLYAAHTAFMHSACT
jgi:hypothetical protein